MKHGGTLITFVRCVLITWQALTFLDCHGFVCILMFSEQTHIYANTRVIFHTH